jgi:hypothetical protein
MTDKTTALDRTRSNSGFDPNMRGEIVDLWSKLQNVACETIKVAELEKAGVRDGDGFWHGDVLGALFKDLKSAVRQLEEHYDKEFERGYREWLGDVALRDEENGCGKTYDTEGREINDRP